MKNKKGFTLLELIITITLFSILIISTSWVFTVGLRTWDSGRKRADIRQDSALAIEKIVREISLAGSITNARSNKIVFLADIDDDGIDETITYDISSNNLNRTIGATTTILASNVNSFTLAYRDLNNDIMSLPSGTANQTRRDNIRVIVVTLDMSNSGENFTLSSSVYARNQ